MRELPISIQRAMLRRNALASLLAMFMVLGMAGYFPWSSMIVTLSLVGIGYIFFISKKAKRLKALKENKRLSHSYAKSIENFVDNSLIIGLPVLAVGLFGLHWLIGFSGRIVDLVFYPSLAALSLLIALGFYLAQLPALFPDYKAKAFTMKKA